MPDDPVDKRFEFRKLYGQLVGLEEANVALSNFGSTVVADYDRLVSKIAALVGEDLDHLKATNTRQSDGYFYSGDVFSRVRQMRRLLEHGYNVGDQVVEVGSLFNTIRDEQLRQRCADLLTARSDFDRVVNQATLVLEDRIRRRAGADRLLVGVKLVNEVIKSDPATSIIIFSDSRDEQEGLANICRGIMQALRNETHHHLVDKFSREDSLSICGFIDRILRLIDAARVVKK
jgi:uncharacterized protein (TIGR02391 family)